MFLATGEPQVPSGEPPIRLFLAYFETAERKPLRMTSLDDTLRRPDDGGRSDGRGPEAANAAARG
jgi:hypothetical protein